MEPEKKPLENFADKVELFSSNAATGPQHGKKVLDFCLLSVSLAVVQAKKFKLLTEDSNRTFNFIIERCLQGKFSYFYCPQFLLRLFKGQFLSQSQENRPGKFQQMLSQLHVHYLAPVS